MGTKPRFQFKVTRMSMASFITTNVESESLMASDIVEAKYSQKGCVICGTFQNSKTQQEKVILCKRHQSCGDYLYLWRSFNWKWQQRESSHRDHNTIST